MLSVGFRSVVQWLRRLRLVLFGCRWLDGRLSSTSVTVLPTLSILAFDFTTSGPLIIRHGFIVAVFK